MRHSNRGVFAMIDGGNVGAPVAPTRATRGEDGIEARPKGDTDWVSAYLRRNGVLIKRRSTWARTRTPTISTTQTIIYVVSSLRNLNTPMTGSPTSRVTSGANQWSLRQHDDRRAVGRIRVKRRTKRTKTRCA